MGWMRLGLLVFASTLLIGCSRETRTAPAAMPTAWEESPVLPSTPTFTAGEAAFAANLDPLTGLPSEIENIAKRPLMAYAIEAERGEQAPEGIEAVELVVEHPPDPLAPDKLRLTALSRLRAGERPDLGPLGPATPLDLEIARAFGAGLTVLSLDPSLNSEGLSIVRFSDAGGASDPSTRDENAQSSDRSALETASVAAGQGEASGAISRVPWAHAEDEAEPASAEDSQAEEASSAQDSAAPAPLSLVLSPLNDEASGEGESAPRGVLWHLDPVIGSWLRFTDAADGPRPVRLGSSGSAETTEVLRAANLLLLQPAEGGVEARWTGQGRALAFAGERRREGLTWSRETSDQPWLFAGSGGERPILNRGNVWMVLWPDDEPFLMGATPTPASP